MQQQTLELSFSSEQGFIQRWDPTASTSRLTPEIKREEHLRSEAMKVQQMPQRYRELKDIIAILGIDELSDSEKSL